MFWVFFLKWWCIHVWYFYLLMSNKNSLMNSIASNNDYRWKLNSLSYTQSRDAIGSKEFWTILTLAKTERFFAKNNLKHYRYTLPGLWYFDICVCFTGESLADSFNSRYSRHSYDNNVGAGGTRRSKQSESSMQTDPEMRDENVQADLDHTRTLGLNLVNASLLLGPRPN